MLNTVSNKKFIKGGLTLQDIVDYAKENNLDPSNVQINVFNPTYGTCDYADVLCIDDYDGAIIVADSEEVGKD